MCLPCRLGIPRTALTQRPLKFDSGSACQFLTSCFSGGLKGSKGETVLSLLLDFLLQMDMQIVRIPFLPFNPGTPKAEEGRSLRLQSQAGLFSEFQATPLCDEIVSQTPDRKGLRLWARCIVLASHAQGPGSDSRYSTIPMTTKRTTTTIVMNQLH